jgi:glycosyltransferase involved in cell wall biosynthesis
MRLSLVIPAHNEAERLEPTLAAYWGEFSREAEVIVVVNGSMDRTADIARTFANAHRGVRVIEIPEAVGKGGAVKAGWKEARGDLVGFVDADLATSPSEFRRILDAARGADGAVGSRWAAGARVIGRSVPRSFVSHALVYLVRLMFGLPFSDTQCGAKVFARKYLPGYLARAEVNDMAFDVELLLLLTRAGARLVEVPTVWVAQPGSSALGTPVGFLKHGFRVLRSLVTLWRRSHAPQFAPAPW